MYINGSSGCRLSTDDRANIVSPIIGLLVLDRGLGYYRSTNLRFIKARPILSLSFIHRLLIFNIVASFIARSLLPEYLTDNQATLDQPIFDLLKLRQIPILFSFLIFAFRLLTSHIAQNIAETCNKYFQYFIPIEIL